MLRKQAVEKKLTSFCDEVEKLASSPFDPRLEKYFEFAGHLRANYAGARERYPPGIKNTLKLLSSQAKKEFGPRQLK